MDKLLEDKIKYCAKLLANSPLADEYKQLILELIGQMTDAQLNMVIESLEREGEELQKLEEALKQLDEEQDKKWEEIKEKQQIKAQEMEDAFMVNVIQKSLK